MTGEPKHDKPFTRPVPGPPPFNAAAAVAKFARTLIGIHEVPPGSNDGPAVRQIQSATGAYRAPWCVSTVQYEDLHVLGHTYADDTANAYYYAQYGIDHGDTIPAAKIGAAVVYHIGAGHAGRVVAVHPDGTCDAVEGNEADAVQLVHRDPRQIKCTFVLRKEYR